MIKGLTFNSNSSYQPRRETSIGSFMVTPILHKIPVIARHCTIFGLVLQLEFHVDQDHLTEKKGCNLVSGGLSLWDVGTESTGQYSLIAVPT